MRIARTFGDAEVLQVASGLDSGQSRSTVHARCLAPLQVGAAEGANIEARERLASGSRYGEENREDGLKG